MPTLSELLAETDAKVDAAVARVNADEDVDQGEITALKAEVARLQALIDSGEATPEQVEALAAINAKLDGLEASIG